MEEYNSPEMEFVPELAAPSAPAPTKKEPVISIEPEFDSEIFEDTVIPEIISEFDEVRIRSKHKFSKLIFRHYANFTKTAFIQNARARSRLSSNRHSRLRDSDNLDAKRSRKKSQSVA